MYLSSEIFDSPRLVPARGIAHSASERSNAGKPLRGTEAWKTAEAPDEFRSETGMKFIANRRLNLHIRVQERRHRQQHQLPVSGLCFAPNNLSRSHSADCRRARSSREDHIAEVRGNYETRPVFCGGRRQCGRRRRPLQRRTFLSPGPYFSPTFSPVTRPA